MLFQNKMVDEGGEEGENMAKPQIPSGILVIAFIDCTELTWNGF